MNKNDDIENCQSCKKPFYVLEHKMGVPGGRDKMTITCPYCHNSLLERSTDGWFTTSKMTEQEIEEYQNNN